MKDLISVSGLEDQGLEVYTRLSEVQLKHYYEPNGGLFIAESPKVVMRALDAGYGCMVLFEDAGTADREGKAPTKQPHRRIRSIPELLDIFGPREATDK